MWWFDSIWGNICKELWQTWCMRGTENPENVVRLHEAPLENLGVLQWQRGWTVNPLSDDFAGSSPASRTQLPYGIMVAQRVLVLLAKVRILLGRQVKKQLHGVIGSIPDFRSGGGGSNPSGVYMEFVAQLVECQVVALVVVGSIPIKLPNASIAQW